MPSLTAPAVDAHRPWRPTAEFHALIHRTAAGELSPLAAAAEIGAAPTAADVAADGRPGMVARLAASLASDMGEGLAGSRARVLVSALCANGPPASAEALAERIDHLCDEEARAFAELLGCFSLALAETARAQNCAEVVFFARDAIPFQVVSTVLARRGVALPHLRMIDINRGMFPDFPERLPAAGDAARRLRTHTQRGRVGTGPALLVDTGVYGTLVGALEEIGAFPGSAPFFLFSKHPRVPGFLNDVDEAAGRGAAGATLIETLCDTLECWPKPYWTSRLEGDASAPLAVARAADPVSVLASLSLYARLARWVADVPLDRLDPAAALARLAQHATPFMLPGPLPTWEHASAWLAQDVEPAVAAG